MMAEADGEGQQEDAASNSRENRNDSLDAVRKISTMAYEDNVSPRFEGADRKDVLKFIKV